MVHFKLNFPTLRFLAGHAAVCRLVLMKADFEYWYTNRNGSLRKCELRVDELPLPSALREYVKSVLRGFFLQVKKWIRCGNDENPGADIFLDARGNLDERRVIWHHFEKRYRDDFFREDFEPFVHFLAHLSWLYPEFYNDFVSIIANLQEVYTFLEGPEYRLVGEELHVVFRFVNRHRVPSAFNALLEWDQSDELTISTEQNNVLVTYCDKDAYDEDMIGIQVDLLQPLQKLEFVKDVLYDNIEKWLPQQVIHILNALDPETQQYFLACLNEEFEVKNFMKRWLTPGFESLFIPMMKLVGQNVERSKYFDLFDVLVKRLDVVGFDSLMLPFWELLPASEKSELHGVLERQHNRWHDRIKEALRKLSQANMELFQVLFDDLSASLSKKQACRLLCIILAQ